MNEVLKRYTIAVEHPDMSGFEHLEMRMIRDKLAEQEARLSAEEREQLAAADRKLIAQAIAFCAELSRVTDLVYGRQRRNVPPSRWWWYLDVVAHLPQVRVESVAS